MSNTGENAELIEHLNAMAASERLYGFDGTEKLLLEAATALAAADARMAELEAQGWELSGSITDLGQRLETAETLLEEARRALEPFIRLADNVFSDGKNATVADEVTLWCFNDTDITFGDLRLARATHGRIGK